MHKKELLWIRSSKTYERFANKVFALAADALDNNLSRVEVVGVLEVVKQQILLGGLGGDDEDEG